MSRKKKPQNDISPIQSEKDIPSSGPQPSATSEIVSSKPSEAAAATLSQYQKWEPLTIHRSKLKNAPYNPRKLDDKAREKLKANLKKVGLLEPPIWNKVTGNLVGGHQRIKLVDSLMQTNDYLITVSQVELDAKTEKEQNIFLNNKGAQGEWDDEKLESLIKNDHLDVLATGFELSELSKVYGDSVFIDQPEVIADIAERVRKAREQYDKVTINSEDLDNPDFYALVIFHSYEERKVFTDALGLEDNRYISGHLIAEKLKIDIAVQGKTVMSADCDNCGKTNDVIGNQTTVVCSRCKKPFTIEMGEQAVPVDATTAIHEALNSTQDTPDAA